MILKSAGLLNVHMVWLRSQCCVFGEVSVFQNRVRIWFIQNITVQMCVFVSALCVCVHCTCIPISLHVPKHLTSGAGFCLSSRGPSHCSYKRLSVRVLMAGEQSCFDSCFLRMQLFLRSRYLGCFWILLLVLVFKMSGC